MAEDDERLRQAIRVGTIGIFDHDHPTDVIFWSLELRQIYGWDPDEPSRCRRFCRTFIPTTGRVIAAVKRAHDPDGDGAFDIEHRIFDRRGRLRWVHDAVAHPLRICCGKRAHSARLAPFRTSPTGAPPRSGCASSTPS